jgi:hypothetical protein
MDASIHPSEQGTGAFSAFPFITEDEFEGACRAFLDRVRVGGRSKVGWSSIRLQVISSFSELRLSILLRLLLICQRPGPILKISQNLGGDLDPRLVDVLPRSPNPPDTLDPRLETCEEDSVCEQRTDPSSPHGRLTVMMSRKHSFVPPTRVKAYK